MCIFQAQSNLFRNRWLKRINWPNSEGFLLPSWVYRGPMDQQFVLRKLTNNKEQVHHGCLEALQVHSPIEGVLHSSL